MCHLVHIYAHEAHGSVTLKCTFACDVVHFETRIVVTLILVIFWKCMRALKWGHVPPLLWGPSPAPLLHILRTCEHDEMATARSVGPSHPAC